MHVLSHGVAQCRHVFAQWLISKTYINSAHCLHAGLRKRVVLINLKIPPSPLIINDVIILINGHHWETLALAGVGGGRRAWHLASKTCQLIHGSSISTLGAFFLFSNFPSSRPPFLMYTVRLSVSQSVTVSQSVKCAVTQPGSAGPAGDLTCHWPLAILNIEWI